MYNGLSDHILCQSIMGVSGPGTPFPCTLHCTLHCNAQPLKETWMKSSQLFQVLLCWSALLLSSVLHLGHSQSHHHHHVYLFYRPHHKSLGLCEVILAGLAVGSVISRNMDSLWFLKKDSHRHRILVLEPAAVAVCPRMTTMREIDV